MALSNSQLSYTTGATSSVVVAAPGVSGNPQFSNIFGTGTLQSPVVTDIGIATGTIAGGGTNTAIIDLTTITGYDGVTALAFVKLVYIDVSINDGSAGGYLRIGNAASNGNQLWFGAVTHTQDIFPGGTIFQQSNPNLYVVVDSTHKNVKILNPHATLACTYTLRAAGLLV